MQFNNILIEPHYFPCVEYFQVLVRAKIILMEVYQHYEKQSYNNRCYILSANGKLPLSVPLHKSSQMAYRDIRIDHSQKWTLNHQTAIRSAYGKSPFFEHYGPEILGLLGKKHNYIVDLNHHILSNCLKLLSFDINLSYTASYENDPRDTITDLRSAIHPKKSSIFQQALSSVAYKQVFGNKFVQNLSIIDLLFCEGPNAGYLLSG